MFYKYSAILDFDPIINKYGEVKGRMDSIAREFGFVNSSLQEMGIKEQLKFYIKKNIRCGKDKDRIFELIDKL